MPKDRRQREESNGQSGEKEGTDSSGEKEGTGDVDPSGEDSKE